MPLTMIGDMSTQFMTARQTTQIKTRLGILNAELSSGIAHDLTAHLRGDASRLTDIDHKLGLIAGYTKTAEEAGQMIAAMQTTLQGISETRGNLSAQMLALHTNSTPAQLDSAIGAGRAAFESMTRALNTEYAGRRMFAGMATDQAALAEPDAMLASLSAAVAGSVTAVDVQTAIDTWFDSPTGGFATMGYTGDTGARLTRRVDSDGSVEIGARADDPALRNLLKAAATAAMAGDAGLALSGTVKAALLRDSGVQLLAAAEPLVTTQAQLGLAEARIEETTVRQSAQKTVYEMMRNDLISADPYDTATQLKEVERQLEMHFTLTARLSNLSLVEYL